MGKQRIAIIGGGAAGLSTAFHLTQQEKWQSKYDITVYQMGWRLGGKGATGRDPDNHWRIEEHGIHGFCRFYFNTWEMMREVYAQLRRSKPGLPIPLMEQAFLPSSSSFSVEMVENRWTQNLRAMPRAKGRPWQAKPPTVDKWHAIYGLLHDLATRGRGQLNDPAATTHNDLVDPDLADTQAQTAEQHARTIQQAVIAAAQNFAQQGQTDQATQLRSRMLAALQMLQGAEVELEAAIQQLQGGPGQALQRRPLLPQLAQVDMFAALLKGLVAAKIWRKDFDVDELDDIDYRAWLAQHGARDATLASGLVTTVPNILFAYPDGDSTQPPRLSTAAWLNWTLRSFLGHGEYFYFMTAGTGETVVLPLFQLLRRRGVKFEFFHRLDRVATGIAQGQKQPSIKALHFERQARTVSGQPYEPLHQLSFRHHKGRSYPVWPNQPLWDQLQYGKANRSRGVDYEAWREGNDPVGSEARTLTLGAPGDDGFDQVVWALPPSMIDEIGDQPLRELWKPTTTHVTTTATQAAQLWLDQDTQELGWDRTQLVPAKSARYSCASMPNPLNGLVAFDDLIEQEDWPKKGPKGLVYLCSQLAPIPGADTLQQALLRVRQSTAASLRTLGVFMPAARAPLSQRVDPRAIDFSHLYVPPEVNANGEQRLAYQYYRANIRPTEAYAQASPGSVKGRMMAWDTGLQNVVVAGDWIYNGFNLGSFESAVSGGRLAAFALIGGRPEDILGFGFLHPGAQAKAHAALRSGQVPRLS